MAKIDRWTEGIPFGQGNCDNACTSQFESPATGCSCRGHEVLAIDKRHFGNVSVVGSRATVTCAWPSASFEGQGGKQIIIDERAPPVRHLALATVPHGGGVLRN